MNWFSGLRRNRLLVSFAGASLTAGLVVIAQVAPAVPVYASTTTQYCDGNQCLNDWNEGQAVNTYTPNVGNNAFFPTSIPGGGTGLQYQGAGPEFGSCIGDYGNSSTNARAGLFENCASGSVPWGAKLAISLCPNGPGVEIKDLHWNGWLGPASTGNGVAFYLNKSTPYCFVISSIP